MRSAELPRWVDQELTPLWVRAATGRFPGRYTQGPKWSTAALRAGIEPWAIAVGPPGNPESALLVSSRMVRGVLVIQALGAPLVDLVQPPVVAADDISAQRNARAAVTELVREARRRSRNWMIDLDQLPEASPYAHAMETISVPRRRAVAGVDVPVLHIDRNGSTDTLLSAQTRRDGRGRERKLRNAHRNVDVCEVTGSALAPLLGEMAALRTLRDADAERSSVLRAGPMAVLWESFLGEASRVGDGVAWTVRVDGVLAAFNLGIRDGQTLRLVDGRVSPTFLQAGIGRILHILATEHAVAAGFDEVEWGRGAHQYKRQVTNRTVRTARVQLASGSLAVGLVTAPERAATVARRSLAQHHDAYAAARVVARKLRRFS